MTTTLIYDERFLDHDAADGPESPLRLEEILTVLQEDKDLWKTLIKITPHPAQLQDILRCHSKELVTRIDNLCSNGGGYIDSDTHVGRDSYEVALLSAGAAITAVDEVLTHRSKNAFSLARPPGHHATSTQAMGFCLLNNAAIAARYAQAIYGLENVLIVDWDVHHGNGTQEIFYHDPLVFYYSIHEFPFYPGSGAFTEMGEGLGKGRTLNIPVPAGIPPKKYRQAFTAGFNAIKKIFTPDLIIISAGFDARAGDPIGQLRLTPNDFYEMTLEVMDLADQFCDNRLISILEGGYVDQDRTLGQAVHQHLSALANK